MAKWLDKYEQGGLILKKKTKDNYGTTPNANAGHSTAGPGWVGEGTTNVGFDYNGAWGGTMQMGGSLPGSVGFMYARTQNPAPANGKYTKKTLASAQNGKEMQYWQDGLDFKPKSISRKGKKIIKDDMGQWAHPGEITEISSPNITMQGVDYPVLGISDTGHTQMMYPNQDYKFDGNKVTEFPMMQRGGWLGKYSPIINDQIPSTASVQKKIIDAEIDKQRRALQKKIEDQGSIKQAGPKQSNVSKAWAIATNPMTALSYKVHGKDLPEHFERGEKNILETATDVINPAFYANELGLGTKDYGSFIKDIATDPYHAKFDKLVSSELHFLNALPLAAEVGPEIRAAVNASKEAGVLSNAYKINPLAEKLKNPNMAYRIADEASYQDFMRSGFVRPKSLTPQWANKSFLTIEEAMADRPTSFPSFSKGEPAWGYLPEEGEGYIYATKQPVVKRGEINPVTGKKVGGRHWAYRPIDETTGKVITELPYDKVNVYSSKPHWWKGYQEVTKPTGTQQITRGPINWWEEPGFMKRNPNFNPKAYVNSPVGNPNASRDIPEGMAPYESPEYKKGGWLNKYK